MTRADPPSKFVLMVRGGWAGDWAWRGESMLAIQSKKITGSFDLIFDSVMAASLSVAGWKSN